MAVNVSSGSAPTNTNPIARAVTPETPFGTTGVLSAQFGNPRA